MRVIAGQCKGRVLFSPKNKFIRPTPDRVKEVIFNFIGEAVDNSLVLDLFSGTGNLSIEALSRGAQSATLVDNSDQSIRLIYKNLALIELLSKCQIVKQDVLRYLKKAITQKKYFDLIFFLALMVYLIIIQFMYQLSGAVNGPAQAVCYGQQQ